MSWLEYARLIEEKDTSAESWESARNGNPNTPFSALWLAVEQANRDRVINLLFAFEQVAQERDHLRAALAAVHEAGRMSDQSSTRYCAEIARLALSDVTGEPSN